MVNRQLRDNIKKTKTFISLWGKFHGLYNNSAAGKETITQEEEKIFLETKSLITNRYEALKAALKINRAVDSEMMDVISHVLSLKGMAAISDKAREKIEKNWQHSNVFVSNMLKDLEAQSQRLSEKNYIAEFLKKVFSKKIIQVVVIVVAVFLLMSLLNIIVRLIIV